MERSIASICCVRVQHHFLRHRFILVCAYGSRGWCGGETESSSGIYDYVWTSLFTNHSFSVWLTDDGRYLLLLLLLLLVQCSLQRNPSEPNAVSFAWMTLKCVTCVHAGVVHLPKCAFPGENLKWVKHSILSLREIPLLFSGVLKDHRISYNQ